MANQGLDRRLMLQIIAKATAASQFPGFRLWAFGADRQHTKTDHTPYEPLYFNAHEYLTIETLTDIIIPADETPGAKHAGVSEFIDFMAAHGEQEIQQPLRSGLASLDMAAGDKFIALKPEEQVALLKKMSQTEGRAFFQLIKRYTTMGYYTSRIGLEELDFPGLRLYSHSPACPHKDDPEHLHLSGAKA